MSFDLTTFLFELINFVLLVFLLRRFVYRPIAASISARRAEIAETRASAAAQLEGVKTRTAELDARQRAVDVLREEVFAEASADAATLRARLLGEAREDAVAERAKAQSMLESEREAALGWVRETAVDQGAAVAGRLLLELAPDAAHDALVQCLLRRLRDGGVSLHGDDAEGEGEHHDGRAHGDDAARGHAEVHGPVRAVVTFARSPTPAETEALELALRDAVGGPVHLSVGKEEELGAGVSLRLGDRTYDATLSGQLDLLRDEARRLLAKHAAA